VPLPTSLVDVGVTARIAKEFGFESIWCADHPIMPVASSSRFPRLTGRQGPRQLRTHRRSVRRPGPRLWHDDADRGRCAASPRRSCHPPAIPAVPTAPMTSNQQATKQPLLDI
jgi:hypothetical protein